MNLTIFPIKQANLMQHEIHPAQAIPGHPHPCHQPFFNKPWQGRSRSSIEDYEKNLRSIVARLKQTKATLIWAHTTPILVGSEPGYAGGEMVDQYNAVAARVMQENGVIINDLNAKFRRMGKPKALNVHDAGDFAPRGAQRVRPCP